LRTEAEDQLGPQATEGAIEQLMSELLDAEKSAPARALHLPPRLTGRRPNPKPSANYMPNAPQLAALTAQNQIALQVDPDGECFYGSVIREAATELAAAFTTDTAVVRPQDVTTRMFRNRLADALVRDQAANPTHYTQFFPGLNITNVAKQIRRPGAWNAEALDYVPQWVHQFFGVNLNILHTDGTTHNALVTGQGPVHTLIRVTHPLPHYLTTAPMPALLNTTPVSPANAIMEANLVEQAARLVRPRGTNAAAREIQQHWRQRRITSAQLARLNELYRRVVVAVDQARHSPFHAALVQRRNVNAAQARGYRTVAGGVVRAYDDYRAAVQEITGTPSVLPDLTLTAPTLTPTPATTTPDSKSKPALEAQAPAEGQA
jgi:hypothetical protein